MTLHTVGFLTAFAALLALMFRRSSWGVSLYLLTFYASPAAFSWGSSLAETGVRWTLLAAMALFIGVHLDGRPYRLTSGSRLIGILMLCYAANATFVHFFFASNPETSWEGLVDLWKLVGLLYLVVKAVKDPFDLKLILFSFVIGAGFVGYEVVVHDVGSERDGRLWVRFGGLNGNQAAAFMCISLTLGGYLLLFCNNLERLVLAVCLALNLEVVLRAMSRATLLALIIGVAWLLLRTKRTARQYALAGVALGVVGLCLVMGPEQRDTALSRFLTTFKPAETRDSSATSRFDFWQAGLEMINDHPIGSGSEAAFESELGMRYISHLEWGEYRSVHNGYLDIAASWGVQGLTLLLAALSVAWWSLGRARREAELAGSVRASFLACTLESVVVVQLVTSMFNANLKGEGYILWMALSLVYARMLPALLAEESTAKEPDLVPEEFVAGEPVSASFGH